MTTRLDQALFDQLLVEAAASPRKRSHRTLHSDHDDPVQRMCVGLLKGTYVRPHDHRQPTKWELLVALQGAFAVLLFDADGTVTERLELAPGQPVAGIELPPNTWHMLFPLDDSAVMLEVKQGPYVPFDPGDFASWAPPEGDAGVGRFLQWAVAARSGVRFVP